MDYETVRILDKAIRFLGLCIVRAAALQRPIHTDCRLKLLELTETDGERHGIR